MKQSMENHIQVKEASVLHHGTPRFSMENMPKKSLKRDHSSRRDNNHRKRQKRLIRERLSYPKMHTTPLNATLIEVLMVIHSKKFICYSSPMKSPLNTHISKKNYMLHKNKGHDTNDYYVLKKEVEMLIAKGYLCQFLNDSYF